LKIHSINYWVFLSWDGKGKDAAYGDAKSEWEETKIRETSAESAEDLVDEAREKLDERFKVGEERMKSEL